MPQKYEMACALTNFSVKNSDSQRFFWLGDEQSLTLQQYKKDEETEIMSLNPYSIRAERHFMAVDDVLERLKHLEDKIKDLL